MKSLNEQSIHEHVSNEEYGDSGIFDLAELRLLLERQTSSDDSDLIAVGVGRVGAGPLGTFPTLVPARPVRSSLTRRVLPFLTVMVASMSVAFAMATVQSASSSEQVVVPSAGSKARPSRPTVVADVDVLPEPEHEPELVAEPEIAAPATTREHGRAVRRTPAPRSERPGAATAHAPEPELADRSVEELLRLATGLPVVPNTPPTQSMEETRLLTLRPSRSAVADAFRNVAPAVRRCAADVDGVATARVFITGSTGRVRSVSVTGVDGVTASCIEDAVMAVRVDPFLQDRLEISFPYRL